MYGWRALFLLGGLALFASLYIVLAVPESEVWRQERKQRKTERVAIREIFGSEVRRNTVLGTLAAGAALTGYWGANTWLPTYLVHERDLDPARMASFVMFLNLGMFAGYQLFGWLADFIGQRRALIWCFAGATVMLPLYASVRDVALLFWLGPVMGLFFAYAGPFGGYFPALFPTRLRSLGAGFCFDVGRGIAALAPFPLGSIAMSIGLSRCMALCALAFFLAAVVVWRMPADHP